MVKANQETLEKSLKIVRNGLDFYEFGAFVEKNAKSYGFKTIENLMGHKLERYVLHAGLSIPMISSPIKGHFEQNNAYAIEPFFVESSAIGFVSTVSTVTYTGLSHQEG
jgi:Methionine aminopeptidase